MEGPRRTWLEALEYHRRGWSVIPIKPNSKKPAIKWNRYALNRASEAKIDEWFQTTDYGLGVIFGEASGGLVSRDFDDLESYQSWVAANPGYGSSLPTVATSRGFHVYTHARAKHIADLRQLIGKPDATGAILVAGGELRCGPGCYSIIPPTVHESGHVYEWIVPLPNGPLPEVDLIQSGLYQKPPTGKRRNDGKEFPPPSLPLGGREFPQPSFAERRVCNREDRDNGDYRRSQSLQKNTEAIVSRDTKKLKNSRPSSSDPRLWSEAVQRAIVESLPEGPGKRHRQVFELARGLKAVPELADAPAKSLEPYVRRWHEMALDKITTVAFEETRIDFLKAWPNVKYPKGQDPMSITLKRAKRQPLPSVSARYEQVALKRLVAFCRELQRTAGNEPFFLSCRTAAQLFDVDPATASRWLYLLVTDEVLVEVEKGTAISRRASRYRYVAADDPGPPAL